MPQTTPDALRYPLGTQPPNVPLDLQNLATDAQAAFDGLRARATSLETATRDTLWRNIQPTNMNGGPPNWGGSVFLRRVGDLVRCTGYLTLQTGSVFIGAAREGTGIFSIDVGFRPIFRNYNIGLASTVNLTNGACQFSWNSSNSRVSIFGSAGTWVANNSVGFTATWDTNEPWPSTLPGVAV